jgi:hypothetical protein
MKICLFSLPVPHFCGGIPSRTWFVFALQNHIVEAVSWASIPDFYIFKFLTHACVMLQKYLNISLNLCSICG